MALRSRSALETGHAHHREVLPMTLLPAIVLAALLLENEHLLGALVPHDLPDHAHSGNERLADLQTAVAGGEQHLFEREGRAGLARELLETDDVAGAHAVLLAARTNDCVVHGNRDRYATRRRLSTSGRRK